MSLFPPPPQPPTPAPGNHPKCPEQAGEPPECHKAPYAPATYYKGHYFKDFCNCHVQGLFFGAGVLALYWFARPRVLLFHIRSFSCVLPEVGLCQTNRRGQRSKVRTSLGVATAASFEKDARALIYIVLVHHIHNQSIATCNPTWVSSATSHLSEEH